MRASSIILFLLAASLFSTYTAAQENLELPAAPSASKRDPKPALAAKPKVSTPDSAAQSAATHDAKEKPPSDNASQPPQAAQSASSSASAADADDSAETIRRTVNEVNVVFTVTDKHGRYVKDLKKNDFTVVDDRRPAQEIRSFHNESDLPLLVGLLVDASNSIRDRFKFEQEAAIEFLNQTIRPRYDKAFVVGFDVTPEVTQDFTDDTEALSRGIRALRPGGGTAMYDALYFSCRDKLLKARQSGPVRRAVILLSDGDDNQSHVSREEAIEMAERADVIVYTISTNVAGSRGRGDKVLERIAEATGGRAFFPFQLTDIANVFLEIQDELRSQYALSYRPADFRADGRYHSIEILAQNHKGLRIRSRRGYYAPAQ